MKYFTKIITISCFSLLSVLSVVGCNYFDKNDKIDNKIKNKILEEDMATMRGIRLNFSSNLRKFARSDYDTRNEKALSDVLEFGMNQPLPRQVLKHTEAKKSLDFIKNSFENNFNKINSELQKKYSNYYKLLSPFKLSINDTKFTVFKIALDKIAHLAGLDVTKDSAIRLDIVYEYSFSFKEYSPTNQTFIASHIITNNLELTKKIITNLEVKIGEVTYDQLKTEYERIEINEDNNQYPKITNDFSTHNIWSHYNNKIFDRFKELIASSDRFKKASDDNDIKYNSYSNFLDSINTKFEPLTNSFDNDEYNKFYDEQESLSTHRELFNHLVNKYSNYYNVSNNEWFTFSINNLRLVPMTIYGLPMTGEVQKNQQKLTVTMILPTKILNAHLEQITKMVFGFFKEYEIKWAKDQITLFVNNDIFAKLLDNETSNDGKPNNLDGIYKILQNHFKKSDFMIKDDILKHKDFTVGSGNTSNIYNEDIVYDKNNNISISLASNKEINWDLVFGHKAQYFKVNNVYKTKSLKIINKDQQK